MAKAYIGKAECVKLNKKYEDAISLYEQALNLSPEREDLKDSIHVLNQKIND
jgi:tetratricopeptide (TPR) repeat protein